jgi:YD repeat-containing protein
MDRLNSLVETIGADPDGTSGPLTSPHSYYQYDLAGNKISTTDPLGDVVRYQYDSLGRLVKTTDQLGRVSTTTYDAAGNVLTDTDAAGNTTYYDYDIFGLLTDTWEPDTDGFDVNAGPHTQYEYDAAGRRTKLIDPDDNETRMVKKLKRSLSALKIRYYSYNYPRI